MKLGKSKNLPRLTVVDALEILSAADGPVHGIGADAEFLLQLFQQIIGAARLTVQLVDEGEDGNMPHGADAEKLSGLRLNALRRVNDHDGGVGSHEGAVGVLRKVLMPGGIEDVDAVSVVFKLHDRRRDRNAALFLELHPVGDGVAGRSLALDGTRLLNGTAVEQQLFRERRFAGVRVRDDRKGAAPVDFFFPVGHFHLLRNNQCIRMILPQPQEKCKQ